MKTITMWGLQVSVALGILALGIAKVSGADIMVMLFDSLGFGPSLRLVVGTVEIIAGLCFLAPRSVMIGTALLTCLSFGMLGATITQVAQLQVRHTVAAGPLAPPKTYHAVLGACETDGSAPLFRASWQAGLKI